MSALARALSVMAAVVLIASSCGGAEPLSACVESWNRPSNFERGAPGAHVRRLDPRPAVPQFAHLSRDRDGRCIVFLDTPSTVDDRRYVRDGDGYSLECAGACGRQVTRGARTFQFRPDGSLPAL